MFPWEPNSFIDEGDNNKAEDEGDSMRCGVSVVKETGVSTYLV